MFQDIDDLRGFLAPTKFIAAMWAMGFLVLITACVLWYSRRLRKLLDRIRTRDIALWKLLGSPKSWDRIGTARNWPTLRRLRVDQFFAQQFDQRVIQELRSLQRTISASLVVLAMAGLLVIYLIWPHR